jgi:tripartite-type tricarboxylate transporter receptor subunit TctC
LLAISIALSFVLPLPASADPVADFYRGKTLTMLVATSPGGDYDLRARLVARHMSRHIPGEPAIIARNMPGAVGLQAANWLAGQAPRDGTMLHAIMQNMSVHAALARDASGQRGDSIVRAPDTRREPGSAAARSSSTPANSSGSATPRTARTW